MYDEETLSDIAAAVAVKMREKMELVENQLTDEQRREIINYDRKILYKNALNGRFI